MLSIIFGLEKYNGKISFMVDLNLLTNPHCFFLFISCSDIISTIKLEQKYLIEINTIHKKSAYIVCCLQPPIILYLLIVLTKLKNTNILDLYNFIKAKVAFIIVKLIFFFKSFSNSCS